MPAYCNRKITNKETGEVRFEEHKIARLPTAKEYEDLVFGWLVEAGVTSNSVLYVKDGATVGIGTGEQDRVGVAEIARDKAYTKHADWISWEKYQKPYNDLRLVFGEEDGAKKQAEIMEQTRAEKGGLPGCAMVSDAFFPFRDGAEVGIREGITSIVQPGGAPTASLNMTEKLLEKLKSKGVKVEYLTLHVGLGTFLPIRSEKVEDH
ncbi:MAG: S-adenosylmethionine:tRNA ribosyltransferase-isomerase, partial [Clostridia bacterium]|nr:S-adenosylmethionine:tRNA ribosyltransferase-isomerase [Clostridia bacterium]